MFVVVAYIVKGCITFVTSDVHFLWFSSECLIVQNPQRIFHTMYRRIFLWIRFYVTLEYGIHVQSRFQRLYSNWCNWFSHWLVCVSSPSFLLCLSKFLYICLISSQGIFILADPRYTSRAMLKKVSSYFGHISHERITTPPDGLIGILINEFDFIHNVEVGKRQTRRIFRASTSTQTDETNDVDFCPSPSIFSKEFSRR